MRYMPWWADFLFNLKLTIRLLVSICSLPLVQLGPDAAYQSYSLSVVQFAKGSAYSCASFVGVASDKPHLAKI